MNADTLQSPAQIKPKKNLIKILIDIFLYIIMFVLLGSLGLSFFSSGVKQFDYQTYLIQSGSMEPTIMTGDVIVVKKSPTYLVNDVITFKDHNDRIVTHRVLEKNTQQNQIEFLTKGDANQANDPHLVNQEKVQGKVVFTLPKVGYLVRFSQTKLGIILLVLAPIIIMAYEEILKIIQEFGKK